MDYSRGKVHSVFQSLSSTARAHVGCRSEVGPAWLGGSWDRGLYRAQPGQGVWAGLGARVCSDLELLGGAGAESSSITGHWEGSSSTGSKGSPAEPRELQEL